MLYLDMLIQYYVKIAQPLPNKTFFVYFQQ